jgi:hypothetical protein
MAERLFVNESTVKTHINHLFAKIGAHDRAQVVTCAYQHGLTWTPTVIDGKNFGRRLNDPSLNRCSPGMAHYAGENRA